MRTFFNSDGKPVRFSSMLAAIIENGPQFGPSYVTTGIISRQSSRLFKKNCSTIWTCFYMRPKHRTYMILEKLNRVCPALSLSRLHKLILILPGKERSKFLDWISSIDFEETHRVTFAKKHEHTCGSLTIDPKYREWFTSPASSSLWCHGKRKHIPPVPISVGVINQLTSRSRYWKVRTQVGCKQPCVLSLMCELTTR